MQPTSNTPLCCKGTSPRQTIKNLITSKRYTFFAIVMTTSVILNIIISISDNPIVRILDTAMSFVETLFGSTAAGLQSIVNGAIGAITTLYIILAIPSICLVAGIWILRNSIKDTWDDSKCKTAKTLISVAMIVEIIKLVSMEILTIVALFVILIASAVSGYFGGPILIGIVLVLVVLLVLGMIQSYYSSFIGIVKGIRSTMTYDVGFINVLGFVRFILYVKGIVGIIINFKGGFLAIFVNLLSSIALICLASLLSEYMKTIGRGDFDFIKELAITPVELKSLNAGNIVPRILQAVKEKQEKMHPKPAQATAKPIVNTSEPVTKAPEPIEKAPEPIEKAPEPIEKAPEPIEKAPEPIEKAPEPIEKAPEPVEKVSEPVEKVSEPVVSVAQKVEPMAATYISTKNVVEEDKSTQTPKETKNVQVPEVKPQTVSSKPATPAAKQQDNKKKKIIIGVIAVCAVIAIIILAISLSNHSSSDDTDTNTESNGQSSNIGVGEVSEKSNYSISSDGTYYVFTNASDKPDTSVLAMYKGKPVKGIASNAFLNNTSITSISIPDGIVSIGSSAFAGCTGLTSVDLPASIKDIGEYAFSSCKNLKTITFHGSEEQWAKVVLGNAWKKNCPANIIYTDIPSQSVANFSYALSKDGSSYTLVGMGTADGGNIVIPSTYNGLPVVGIGAHAFEGVNNISKVTILDGVVNIGEYAFSDSSLTSISIPDSVVDIGAGVFSNCKNLSDIRLPSKLTYIENYTFEGCLNLTTITIPGEVIIIGAHAFDYCDSMACIYLPAKLKIIDDYAFYQCSALSEIQFGGTTAMWRSITKGDNWNELSSTFTIYCADGSVRK